MKLENQVCSLELSKRLKELGVKQESYFHWYISYRSNYAFILESKEVNCIVDSNDTYSVYKAFTIAELGEMLPPYIEKDGKTYWCHFNIKHIQYMTRDSNCDDLGPVMRADNEADVRAMMLIYLLENGLIKADSL